MIRARHKGWFIYLAIVPLYKATWAMLKPSCTAMCHCMFTSRLIKLSSSSFSPLAAYYMWFIDSTTPFPVILLKWPACVWKNEYHLATFPSEFSSISPSQTHTGPFHWVLKERENYLHSQQHLLFIPRLPSYQTRTVQRKLLIWHPKALSHERSRLSPAHIASFQRLLHMASDKHRLFPPYHPTRSLASNHNIHLHDLPLLHPQTKHLNTSPTPH